MKNRKISLLLKESSILEFVFVSALLFFFFSDAANKILIYKGTDFKRISIITRAVYELVFILIILLFINKARFQFVLLFFIWFSVFLAGQVILSFRVDYHYNYMENINIFNKYMFVFIVYFAIFRYRFFEKQFARLIKILEFLFIGNSILILLGFVFKIVLFSTYLKNNAYTYRFGYSGLIPAQNEATLFLFIAICYFYFKQFVLEESTGKWKYYLIIISALLLGTKGMYLFLILLFSFHFIKNSTPNQRKIAAIFGLSFILFIYLLIQSDLIKFWLHYFVWNLEEKGIFSTLLSGRNTLFKLKFYEQISFWTPVNFFTGGQDQTRYLMEMDIFDAFLFFGFFGVIILVLLYFKTLFSFSLKNPFLMFFVFAFFLISFFAGHFFTSAINSLYLCIVTLYFYQTQQPKEAIGENTGKQNLY